MDTSMPQKSGETMGVEDEGSAGEETVLEHCRDTHWLVYKCTHRERSARCLWFNAYKRKASTHFF